MDQAPGGWAFCDEATKAEKAKLTQQVGSRVRIQIQVCEF